MIKKDFKNSDVWFKLGESNEALDNSKTCNDYKI